MNKIKSLFLKYRELVLYVVFGAATTAVNFVVFELWQWVLGDRLYLISNALAWVIAVLFAYVVNKRWVFESRTRGAKAIAKELASFSSARLLSLGLEQLGLYLLVDVAGFGGREFALFGWAINGTTLAKIFLAVLVIILNYFFSKFIVFKTKE